MNNLFKIDQEKIKKRLKKLKKDLNKPIGNKKKSKKRGFTFKEMLAIVVVTVIIGTSIGAATVYAVYDDDDNQNVIYETEEKIIYKTSEGQEYSAELQEFVETYEYILDLYYEELDEEELITNAINGMLEEINDPYSTYMSPEEVEAFNERLLGDYQGIGSEISISDNGNVMIYNPFDGSPAKAAGLIFGDEIIAVDGENVEGQTTLYVSSLIKGVAGTDVVLTITREDETFDITVTRAAIEIPSVTSEILEEGDQKIGYIQIDIFSAITNTQFEEAVLELEAANIDSLIIDVRDNTGGYLHVVSDMVSLFIPSDKNIYQLEVQDSVTEFKASSDESRDYEVVVLMNGASASASEILAGAFSESYGATLVGTTSYGKGTVQETFSLDNGGLVKFTTKKWLTPDGNWIHEIGIEPDVEVELNEEYYLDRTHDKDNQLQKAIEILTN